MREDAEEDHGHEKNDNQLTSFHDVIPTLSSLRTCNHSLAAGMRSAQRRLQPIVDPIRPVSGGDGRHELDNLLLGQVFSKRVQIGGLDVPRKAGQKVGEA